MGNKVNIWDVHNPASIRLKLALNHGARPGHGRVGADVGPYLFRSPTHACLFTHASLHARPPMTILTHMHPTNTHTHTHTHTHTSYTHKYTPHTHTRTRACAPPPPSTADVGQGDEDEQGEGAGKASNMNWLTRSDVTAGPRDYNPLVNDAIQKANKDVPEVTQVWRGGLAHTRF